MIKLFKSVWYIKIVLLSRADAGFAHVERNTMMKNLQPFGTNSTPYAFQRAINQFTLRLRLNTGFGPTKVSMWNWCQIKWKSSLSLLGSQISVNCQIASVNQIITIWCPDQLQFLLWVKFRITSIKYFIHFSHDSKINHKCLLWI